MPEVMGERESLANCTGVEEVGQDTVTDAPSSLRREEGRGDGQLL